MAGGRVRQTIRLIDDMLAVHIGAHEAAIVREACATDRSPIIRPSPLACKDIESIL
jgi:hypothetical protein